MLASGTEYTQPCELTTQQHRHRTWASTATGNRKGSFVCGLWRARTMLLLNSCHLQPLNYSFSADLWISILSLWQKGCLGKTRNKQLRQIPGIQVLAVFQKKQLLPTAGLNIVLVPFVVIVRVLILRVWVQGLALTHRWEHGFHCRNTSEHKPHQQPKAMGKKPPSERSEGVRTLLQQNH